MGCVGLKTSPQTQINPIIASISILFSFVYLCTFILFFQKWLIILAVAIFGLWNSLQNPSTANVPLKPIHARR